ncbi:hypothetical protein BGAL_0224g00200 [Botrytis galanthina]|uniref:GED domain-containing protein n=1 Tax=Botrytis galanthina TaxID=278940 RepID=A0A4S8QUI0_9HELO|nr:hypothetical protein BGAL_0224g00200 [Botrytis galanthina]
MANKPTGMPAPRKLRIETITEEAPSHDGTPTITSYRRQLEPYPRPLYAHRVYDTTPDAAIPGRAAELAKIIHEKTLDYRGGYGRDEPDRIEVVALPMPKDATAEQRVKKCKAHHLAEVVTREKEWHLSRTFVDDGYQRAIVIIDQLREEWREAFDRPFEMFGVLPSKSHLDWRWESNRLPYMNSPDWETNPYGTYLMAEWDLEITAELQRMLEEDGDSIPEEKVSPHALVHMDKDLRELRGGIEQYYIEYAGQGLIEEELSLRASGGDWEHVKPMNARVRWNPRQSGTWRSCQRRRSRRVDSRGGSTAAAAAATRYSDAVSLCRPEICLAVSRDGRIPSEELSGSDAIFFFKAAAAIAGWLRITIAHVTRVGEINLEVFAIQIIGAVSAGTISQRSVVRRRVERCILTVIPCDVDIATQEILKLANMADPSGVRTMGVLTKPDLATEKAIKDTIIDLVNEKPSTLKLEYYIVKNRTADDNNISTIAERLDAEKAFFMHLLGRPLLIAVQEISKVRSEIEQHLLDCRQNLETMGPSRTDQSSQRLYLAKLTSKFQDIAQAALNGYYTGDKIFKRYPNFQLITKIIKLSEDFSDVFWRHGHKQHFGDNWDNEGESFFGRKMGEFGGTILAIVFEEQTEKWVPLVLSHTSRVIEIVHEYIFQLIAKLCPEEQVRDQLWNALLVDKLREGYRKAMNHAHFLLDIERGGRPITFNHYFNTNLQKGRSEHISDSFNVIKISSKGNQYTVNKDNRRQVCEDILDTLASYYKVSRKRFVDFFCQQVVHHFLLEGSDSPLKVLGPELVIGLDPEQLEQIAGEDIESRQKRQGLERKIESYEAALKVLRA